MIGHKMERWSKVEGKRMEIMKERKEKMEKGKDAEEEEEEEKQSRSTWPGETAGSKQSLRCGRW